MDYSINNFFNSIFKDYTNLENMKLKTKEWFNKYHKPENQAIFEHNVTKAIRLIYQEMLLKCYEKPSNDYIELSKNVSNFTIWMSDENMIDYSNCIFILEDIIDTFPIKDMEILFDILENSLKSQLSKSIEVFNQKRKLAILRISNSILKRLSSSMDTKFKGRIQMALASIFPISDKSGVNIKGLYNRNNYSFSSDNIEGNHSHSNKLINSKFYKQFWILLKLLSNPFAIFSHEAADNTDTIESLDHTKDVVVLENDITQNKFDIFLVNMNKIISFFSKNKINLNDNSESILTYPKYLTSADLFDLQLNDSSFRKTILLQFLIVLKSFLKPISQVQKKSFVFSDKEKTQINETIDKIMSILNPNKDPNHYLNLVLNDEEMWEKWKEAGCQTYEKFFDENTLKDFEKYVAEYEKKKADSKEKKYMPLKARTLFKVDTSQINNELNKHLDFNMDELQKFEINHSYTGGIQSDNPFMGDYLERLLKDSDPTNEIEDGFKITNSDPSFNWKFMRLISQYDISRLFQEKVENIIKDYADHYGIKILSEKPSSINTQNINFNINQNQSSGAGKPQILNNIGTSENSENPRNFNTTSNPDLNGNQNLDLNEKEHNHNYSSKDESRDKDKKKRKR